MPTDNEAIRFEEYAAGTSLDLTRARFSGRYYSTVTEDCWLAWQARAAVAPQPAPPRVYEHGMRHCTHERESGHCVLHCGLDAAPASGDTPPAPAIPKGEAECECPWKCAVHGSDDEDATPSAAPVRDGLTDAECDEADQRAFNAFAHVHGLSLVEGRSAAEGEYVSANTHYARRAWRAARATYRELSRIRTEIVRDGLTKVQRAAIAEVADIVDPAMGYGQVLSHDLAATLRSVLAATAPADGVRDAPVTQNSMDNLRTILRDHDAGHTHDHVFVVQLEVWARAVAALAPAGEADDKT